MDWQADLQRTRERAGTFWRWWRTELIGLVPFGLGRARPGAGTFLVLECRDRLWSVLECRSGNARPITEIPPEAAQPLSTAEPLDVLRQHLSDNTEFLVRIPRERLLVREVTLPAAARENLRQVLAFEMDRYTPFRAEQVYYDYRIMGDAAERERVRVMLTVAPRAVIDGVLERLEAWGLRADAVEPLDDEAGPCHRAGINLLPAAPAEAAAGDGWNRPAWGLAILAGVLAVLLGLTPLLQAHRTERALAAEANALRDEAEQASALRRELDTRRERLAQLVAQKTGRPLTVAVLDELTRVLPDHTWIQFLGLNERILEIQGESEAAAELIERIDGSPLFRNVAFASPVTQNPRTEQERFRIAAEVVPQTPADGAS